MQEVCWHHTDVFNFRVAATRLKSLHRRGLAGCVRSDLSTWFPLVKRLSVISSMWRSICSAQFSGDKTLFGLIGCVGICSGWVKCILDFLKHFSEWKYGFPNTSMCAPRRRNWMTATCYLIMFYNLYVNSLKNNLSLAVTPWLQEFEFNLLSKMPVVKPSQCANIFETFFFSIQVFYREQF